MRRDPAARGAWAASWRKARVARGRPLDPAFGRGPPGEALRKGLRPCGDPEIVIILGPVKGAEVLKMQSKKPPTEGAPPLGTQALRECRRDHQRPAFALGGHTTHAHRITQRKGAAIARRGHVEPEKLLPRAQIGKIRAQPPRARQKRDHRHYLPETEERQRRASRGHAPG